MQAPFGSYRLSKLLPMFSTICFKLYLLLPCLSFALCSVFNVQTSSSRISRASLPPPGFAHRRKLASARSLLLFKSKHPFRFEVREKGGSRGLRFRRRASPTVESSQALDRSSSSNRSIRFDLRCGKKADPADCASAPAPGPLLGPSFST